MFKQAKIALEKGTATMDKIKSRYQVSTEVEGLLNAK